ncbi:MAG TPA: hypothetical protein VFE82_16975 [Ramlibacter sp.]|jgi:hypothetical protein|uniref:hypothetical protein n=1 Tax=Ramlibacter sp. TaxID=1917967 RepID=UPI002D4FFB00|nr:hypothetical protein [Ramlibacter sp.]HZY20166.1 hypothetical protein [Ramlibacter sp.]
MTAMRRRCAAVLCAALLLAGCGGGAVVVGSGGSFNLAVVVGGFAVREPVAAGQDVTFSVRAGESIEVDANEPATWSFSVNGGPLFQSGTAVQVGGLQITQATLTSSRVVLQTAIVGTPVLPAFVTLTATSRLDAAQVAVVRLEVR